MNQEKDYIRDLAEIRAMMERTSKFLSLSGWAGTMAGVYALAGAYIVYEFLHFNPDQILPSSLEAGNEPSGAPMVILVALAVLVLSLGTAIFLSNRKANVRGEKVWNATSRKMLISMAVPLVAGGILVLVLFLKGLIGLLAPMTLIFYGLALYNASKFTYEEVRSLGIIQMTLGWISAYYIEYGLLLWAVGFGVAHIAYGTYMHSKYER